LSDKTPVKERNSECTVAWTLLVPIIARFLGVDAALLNVIGLETNQGTGVGASHLVIIGIAYTICRTVIKWFRETKAYGKAQTASR
jgi:hypothetical protein